MCTLLCSIVPSLRVGSSLQLNFNLLQISLIGNLGNQVIRKEDMNIHRVYSVIILRLYPGGKTSLFQHSGVNLEYTECEREFMCLHLTNYSRYFSGNAKSEKNPCCQMEKAREHFHEIFLSPGDFSLETLLFPSQILTVFFVFTSYSIFVLCFTPCSSEYTYMS